MSLAKKSLEKSTVNPKDQERKQRSKGGKPAKAENLPLESKSPSLISEEVNSLTLLPINTHSRNLVVNMSVAINFLTLNLNTQTTSLTFLEFSSLWSAYRDEYYAIRGKHDLHALMHEEDVRGKPQFHEHIEFKKERSVSQKGFQVFLDRLYEYQNSPELRKNNTRINGLLFWAHVSMFSAEQRKQYPQHTINEIDDFLSAGLSAPAVLDECLPEPNMSAAWQPFDSFHVTQHTYTREVPVVTEPVVEKFDFSKLFLAGAGIGVLVLGFFLYKMFCSFSSPTEEPSQRSQPRRRSENVRGSSPIPGFFHQPSSPPLPQQEPAKDVKPAEQQNPSPATLSSEPVKEDMAILSSSKG